jgi:putative hydrolase of the HAD superfamily
MPSEPHVRAVFFDLDDTLCDAVGSRPQRVRKALEVFCQNDRGYDLEALLVKALEAHPSLDREVRGLRSVFAELGLGESAGARAAYASYASYFEPLRLFEGVAETLRRLSRRRRLGIITNGVESVQQGKIRFFRLEPYLECAVISEAIGIRKPDPRIFQHALSLAAVEPGEAVFVGDRLDVDIAGAKASGMRAVWFNHWGGSLDGASPGPDAVIERFSELAVVLKTLAGG